MAEFLFVNKNYAHTDPEKHRRGVHVKGDFWNYKLDGWSSRPGWAQSAYPKNGVVIRCPEISFAEAEAADQRRPWRDDFDYEVVSASQAQVTLRVWNKNVSPTGVNQLTRERVETFLTQWGCTDISFSNGSVTFTFDLWAAVRSDGFWEIDFVATKAVFELLSYNPTTRIGRIQITVVDLALNEDSVLRTISNRGGTIVSNNYPVIVCEFERDTVVTKFRTDIKLKAEKVYKRHRFSIDPSEVDSIVAQGGIVTMSRAEFLSKLIDHMNN